jgi:GcrA cell cycle regulator
VIPALPDLGADVGWLETGRRGSDRASERTRHPRGTCRDRNDGAGRLSHDLPPQERAMHHAHADFDWNDETIGRLRALWAEGHSTAEIGRRLGVSKNAVVGKSHRLKLTARPSPIRRGGLGQASHPRRPRCPSLAELQSPLRPAPALWLRPIQGVLTPPAPPAPPTQPMTATPIRAPLLGKQPCCWPIGEPGTRRFRFCDMTNEAGKPYCPDHCKIAYRKARDRRDTA